MSLTPSDYWIVAACLLAAMPARGETVTVASASNFLAAAEVLVADFEAATDHDVRLVPGSTGRLYAQIVNGAPFDVFLAADADRPQKLEAASRGVPSSRFTYATGRLVVWSTTPGYDNERCLAALAEPGGRRIAMANPVVAPYGQAAQRFLEARGWWSAVEGRVVLGENVSQTAQFVATRNADVGLVSRSLVMAASLPAPTCLYDVPAGEHGSLDQQAILLTRAAGNVAATAFMEFLQGRAARARIRALGYALTAEEP